MVLVFKILEISPGSIDTLFFMSTTFQCKLVNTGDLAYLDAIHDKDISLPMCDAKQIILFKQWWKVYHEDHPSPIDYSETTAALTEETWDEFCDLYQDYHLDYKKTHPSLRHPSPPSIKDS